MLTAQFVALSWLLLGANAQFAPPNVQSNWGPYTPWTPLAPYRPLPAQCTLTSVNILQRHGARYPTKGAGKDIKDVVDKLQAATSYTDPAFAFLTNYTYTLQKSGDLIPFGATQSYQAGQAAFLRYIRLVSPTNLPFVRASSGQRVIDSATNWTAGFTDATNGAIAPTLNVILYESQNDTLHDLCPNAGTSDPETDAWTAIYAAPIADRFNSKAIGANITAADISNLIAICPFETLVDNSPGQLKSPFCDLFTPAEFAEWEYYTDLDKYYDTGYGQALGPVQGVGYVNELIARLTGPGSVVLEGTQVNETLDTSSTTFPLNATFYADFTHDSQMIAIYSAMGLFKQGAPLDTSQPDPRRTWVASRIVPFSSRMIVEKLSCTKPSLGSWWSWWTNRQEVPNTQDFVRILVNDVLQPLNFCGGDGNGLCTVDAFVQSQGYARSNGNGDFAKCWN